MAEKGKVKVAFSTPLYTQALGRGHRYVGVPISELAGAALNWAVARAVGVEVRIVDGNRPEHTIRVGGAFRRNYNPSTDWAQGGPLIEAHNISITPDPDAHEWLASVCKGVDPGGDAIHVTIPGMPALINGPTPLIAAMRAIVAKHAGADTVSVPKVLVQEKGVPNG